MTAGQEVRAAWVAPRYQHTGRWGYIYLSQWDHTEEAPYPESRHWCAALDYTHQRQEEVRQLKVDMKRMDSLARQADHMLVRDALLGEINHVERVQLIASFRRILALVQAALAEAQRGMKKEAL